MVNNEIVKIKRISTSENEAQLKAMIDRHYQLTGSEKADEILNNWDDAKDKFWQVYPPSEVQTALVNADAELLANTLRVSASAPTGDVCFLPAGGVLTPEQGQRCAD